MSRKYLLLCWFICQLSLPGCAQSVKLEGVYVGAELYTTPFNGMQIDHIVIYFKNNGTFNNELDQADWKTKVSGTYQISNNLVQLNFKNGDEAKKYKLAANGKLQSTSGIKHTLHKVKKVSSIPAGTYERRTASGSGGVGTGMPAVGVFASDFLYFDGKGHFSMDRSSVVGIGGEAAGGTVGGSFENKNSNSGTYQLGDGDIALTFGNGKVARHSFFYSPPNEEDLIIVDGALYFREEDSEAAGTTVARENPSVGNVSSGSASAERSGLLSASQLLTELRKQYGGENIDKISTVRERASLNNGMEMVVLTDLTNNRIRAELRQNGKLLLVKQLDGGQQGWQWLNGSTKQLTKNEKDELRAALYQGVMGLHKSLNADLSKAEVSSLGGDYLITFYKEGHKILYLVGKDYTLKGNASSINGENPSISVYKNFSTIKGVRYPMTTEATEGKDKLISTTTSIEFNPVFTEQDWKKL